MCYIYIILIHVMVLLSEKKKEEEEQEVVETLHDCDDEEDFPWIHP